jgi:hypothetical protein
VCPRGLADGTKVLLGVVEAMGLEPTNLLTASQALYQLSYAPVGGPTLVAAGGLRHRTPTKTESSLGLAFDLRNAIIRSCEID